MCSLPRESARAGVYAHHRSVVCVSQIQAPKPSAGPHKTRECLPLIILLRNRLNYALTGREASIILIERKVLVDGKVRTDPNFPAGFMGMGRRRSSALCTCHKTFGCA